MPPRSDSDRLRDAPRALPTGSTKTGVGNAFSRLRAALLTTLVCGIVLEVGARVYWRVKFGIPVGRPNTVLHALYPEMRGVESARPETGGERFDVLLLGGSSLNRDWGQVQPALREQLMRRGYKRARIYNLAMPGHTSQDSRLKYALLKEARFDLVVVYDGINETRVNNASPEVFRDDYSHYGWYELANALAPYHGRARFALPMTLRRIAIAARQAARQDRYVSTDSLQQDWIQYGRTARSAVTFERNLNKIIALAKERGDQLLLMTFATYLPDNYTREAFEAKNLNYGLHLTALETWGSRENILSALELQNQIVRKLAVRNAGVLFVDQADLMKGVPDFYNDVCHFTLAGSVKFAENLVSVLPSSSVARLPRVKDARAQEATR
ncbi:MAG: hypothetical protein ACT4P6_03630 [Gemmatimonadaceae bacterium]